MTRVILASYDLLTPFDLKGPTFRVNVELPTHYHAQNQKMFFLSQKVNFGHFSKMISAHCATDVTGFGILGHAQNLAECQNEEVDFIIDTLPCISGTVQSDSELNEMFKLVAGKSAETSGGLLLAIGPENADSFIEKLKEINGHDIWKVGSVVSGSKSAKIATGLKILEISSDENGKLKTL